MPELPYPSPPLADRELVLRPYRPDDLAGLVRELDDPEIPRWTNIPPAYGEPEGRAFLEQVEPQRLMGQALALALGEDLQGAVGLGCIDWIKRTADVGYWVAASQRRRGLASRAVRLLSDWALTSTGLERLNLFANPANQPSQRVAEKAGFTREGTLRSLRYRQGAREDLVIFSRLPTDLQLDYSLSLRWRSSSSSSFSAG